MDKTQLDGSRVARGSSFVRPNFMSLPSDFYSSLSRLGVTAEVANDICGVLGRWTVALSSWRNRTQLNGGRYSCSSRQTAHLRLPGGTPRSSCALMAKCHRDGTHIRRAPRCTTKSHCEPCASLPKQSLRPSPNSAFRQYFHVFRKDPTRFLASNTSSASGCAGACTSRIFSRKLFLK